MTWPSEHVANILNASRIRLAACEAAAEMARDLHEAGEQIPWPEDERFTWEPEALGFGAFVVVLRIRGVRGLWASSPFRLAREGEMNSRRRVA